MAVYNPNIPVAHTQNDADPIRENFNALKDLIDAVPAGPPGPQGPQGETGPQGPQGVPGPGGPETDPVFAAWLATPPNVSAFANDAGYSNFSPNNAGELYNCFGIFDGGNITNGVRVGGNQVDLQLYNGGQKVVVLSAGQKQLIGYPDYAAPVPTVAACWADGVLRDAAGNAFLTMAGLLAALPASDPHDAGALWNDAGTLKVSLG